MTQCEALMAIAKRDGGLITPAAVIAEARNPKSVLHGAFTWDDRKAAAKWRIYEAQKLIRNCRITIEDNGCKTSTYAFVGLSSDRESGSEDNPYRLASSVSKYEDLVAIAEQDALSQLKSLEERYRHIKRLNEVWAAIDRL